MVGTNVRALGLLKPEAKRALALVLANLVLGAAALIEPLLFGRVVDSLGRRDGTAWALIGVWGGFGVVSLVAGAAVAVGADRLAHRRRLAAMAQAFERAVLLAPGRVSEQGAGRLVRVILAGGDSVFWLVLPLMRDLLPAFFAVLLLAPLAFAMNAVLASVLVGLALAYALANAAVIRRTETGQRRVNRLYQDVSGRIADVVSNVAVVQVYANLQREAQALAELARDVLKAQYPVLNWWAVLAVLTRAASTIAMATIFCVGAALTESGKISVGEIVSFAGFAGLLISRLDVLSGAIARLFAGAPQLQALLDLIEEAPAVVDDPHAEALHEVEGRIGFEHVTCRLSPDGAGVFDVDVVVEAGAMVAVVGASGAGKTTLMALLKRLRDPDSGRITLDGRDIRRIRLESLRAATAVVFQDAGLFNRSIADNLRLARPEASDRELEAALEAAEALEFVREKPGGLDYVIGERGQLLSGGERQRLAIARAMLKDAPVLLLDEATSALDTVTEAKVKAALDKARRGRTTIVIAHRLSTVRDADLVLVMDRGRIVERGGFSELLDRNGRLAEMARESGLINIQDEPVGNLTRAAANSG
jgi:ATP-binding cassette subfamily B protein